MRRLTRKNPHKTLYFRLQKALASVSNGMDSISFAEAWAAIYPVLLEVTSDLPWAVSLAFNNIDRYAHGKSSITFIFRFKDDSCFYDCKLILSTLDIIIFNSFELNSTNYPDIKDWMLAVKHNKNFKALSDKVKWKRILNYTKD